ncbi:MAG: TetR/AcrR family transcriptional regulator [Bacilli bacterium]|nr:TetR/AcrR family transcriptional regulator [Bacilli bacterium]
MSKLKENTLSFIVLEAKKLFLSSSINDVKMKDIAASVGIGEATLYRYFETKENIVMQVAVKMAEEIHSEFFSFDEKESGFEQMKRFYKSYLDVFARNSGYFKFIKELDAYVLSLKNVEKGEYQNEIDLYKEDFVRIYQKGLEDKTIRGLSDSETFYYATTHSLINLCMSLSSGTRIEQDSKIDKTKEIELMISLILNSLKGE